MKHINNFRIFESMKDFKNREELDKLSETDINEYYSSLIQNYNTLPVDYLNELDLYKELRFKLQERFFKKLLDREAKGELSNDSSRGAEDLILKVIKRPETYKYMLEEQLKDLKKKVGEPKYIL